MPFNSFCSENLQLLNYRLGHLSSIDEDQCRRVSLDDFFDAIDIVVEDFLNRQR